MGTSTGKDRLAAALKAKGVTAATSNSNDPGAPTSTSKQRHASTSRAKQEGAGARRGKEEGGGTRSQMESPKRFQGRAPGVFRPTLVCSQALDVVRSLEPNSIDLIFTDPGLGGDGPGWVNGCPGQPDWDAMYKAAKPGAHLAVFSSRKYSHRVVTRAEDAGFEMRDTLLWIYPKGMPMALDIGQAVDKKMGGEGKPYFRTAGSLTDEQREMLDKDNPWFGWGTELRPTWEPISILRKLPQGSVADNVLRWGTGAMNIDATRIESGERDAIATYIPEGQGDAHGLALVKHQQVVGKTSLGRWPADALFSHAPECRRDLCDPRCAVAALEREFEGTAKFFYCPKADRREKDFGIGVKANTVKGVKPVSVCRWVIQLLLPPGGVLLDPYMGSGSIGLGLIRLAGTPIRLAGNAPEPVRLDGTYIGVDVEPAYVEFAEKRFAAWCAGDA